MKAKKKESYASIFSAMVEQWNELQLIASFSTFLTDFEDTQISAARLRMKELFNTTKGFGVGQKPSREELHERGRIH